MWCAKNLRVLKLSCKTQTPLLKSIAHRLTCESHEQSKVWCNTPTTSERDGHMYQVGILNQTVTNCSRSPRSLSDNTNFPNPRYITTNTISQPRSGASNKHFSSVHNTVIHMSKAERGNPRWIYPQRSQHGIPLGSRCSPVGRPCNHDLVCHIMVSSSRHIDKLKKLLHAPRHSLGKGM